MVARGLGEGEKKSDCLIGKGFFFFESDENIFQLNTGDSCIILNIVKIAELGTLKESILLFIKDCVLGAKDKENS